MLEIPAVRQLYFIAEFLQLFQKETEVTLRFSTNFLHNLHLLSVRTMSTLCAQIVTENLLT